MENPGVTIVICLTLGLFGLGVYDVLRNFEDNNCEMTYMYEIPEYLKIVLRRSITARYPKYNLYFYGEGRYAHDAEKSKFHLNGIPVLFIPGNAGSFRQVRSLGSVALRMSESLRTKFHFNFFALDFNEDLSGLFGPVLSDQTEFAHICIRRILELYAGGSIWKPMSVFIVGHSMGGMVARALYTLPNFDHSLVNGILTQATPHQMPVIAVDHFLFDFYKRVNSYWRDDPNRILEDILIVSTGGGYRDVLVRNGLTHLTKNVRMKNQVSSLTMSIPKAWVSTDHLAHVWCKQIVMATVRALFDCVDRKTNQISEDHLVCRESFKYHYESNSGPKFYESLSTNRIVPLDFNVEWTKLTENFWNFKSKAVTREFYTDLEISRDVSSQLSVVAITNMDGVSWIGGCTPIPETTKCKEMRRFDLEAHLIPPNELKLKALHLDNYTLAGFPKWIVHVAHTKPLIPVKLIVDIYNVNERHIVFDVPYIMKFLWNFVTSFDSKAMILNGTSNNAIFFNVSLKGFEIPLQAYTVELTCNGCTKNSSEIPDVTVVKLYVPWVQEHVYNVLQKGQNGHFSLKLQSGRPMDFEEDAQLHFYFAPACSYTVALRLSWSELSGQFVRFYGVFIPTFLVIQVCLTLSWQLRKLSKQGIVPSFSESHLRCALQFKFFLSVAALRYLLSLVSYLTNLKMPVDDILMLKEQNIWCLPLPLFLYLVAFAFMSVYAQLVHRVVSLLSRFTSICCQRYSSLGIISFFTAFQYIWLIASAVVAYWVCGTLGILSAYIVLLAQTAISLANVKSSVMCMSRLENRFNIIFTLVILLMVTVALNVIPFVIWIYGLPWNGISLVDDPSRNIGIIACISSMILIYSDYCFDSSETQIAILALVHYLSSSVMAIYALVSVYRVSYIVTALLLLFSLTSITSKH